MRQPSNPTGKYCWPARRSPVRGAAPSLLWPATIPTVPWTRGGTGIVKTSLGTGNAAIKAVALQPNGDIVVAGYATQSSSGQDFAVARYKPDGALDTGFGNGGTVITPVGSSTTDGAQSVVVQPDGKVVAAGYSGTSSQYQLALARYDADGSLDTAFNASGSKPGTVTTTVGSAPDSRI